MCHIHCGRGRAEGLDPELTWPAQYRDRRRIAVQVDVLLPPDRPGFPGTLASICYQGVGARRARMVKGCCRDPEMPFPYQAGCTGGSRPWLPDLRLVFQ
jgi:hypothetical protein